jgi:hypothetical protein
MPVAYAATNRKDATMDLHPEILGKVGPAWGPSGAYRAVRCRLTASGTYAAGGTALPDVGIKDVQGVLLIIDGAPAGTWTGVPRWNAATSKLQLYSFAGAEHAAAAATGQFEVVIYGFSG